MAELKEERKALDAREAAWLRKVAQYDRSDDWRAEGYVSAANALRHACRMNPGVARAHVELARKLEELPELADAFGRGEVSRAHAQVVANAYTPERAAELDGLEGPLVDAALVATPTELSNVVRHLTDAIDGDGGAAHDEVVYGRRRWHMSDTLDGMLKIDALVDGEAARYWKAAINAELDRDHCEGDTRLLSQRRADAATNLVRRALDTGQVGNSRAVRPHLSIVADLDSLAGATPELVAAVRTEARTGGLSAATLERISCDCDISRVITNGRSEVLDVGRATRTISAALWKALVVRDRHCTAPGCNQPPERCEAHHRWHWSRGGPTNLDNLELLCWYHHRDIPKTPKPARPDSMRTRSRSRAAPTVSRPTTGRASGPKVRAGNTNTLPA